MVIVHYDEETDFGQDVMDLVSMCVAIEEHDFTITQLRKYLKRISGQLEHIYLNLHKGNEEYWILGGADNAAFRFTE